MRIAYADPPYPGKAKKLYDCEEIDHEVLIENLETYDAWALSTNEISLSKVLKLCPDNIRIGAWTKRGNSIANIQFCLSSCWEPVIVKPAKRKWEETVRGYHSSCSNPPPGPAKKDFNHFTPKNSVDPNNTWRRKDPSKGHAGFKNMAFCFWVFSMLNARPEDDFVDMFPGSGAVTRAWDRWKRQERNSLMKWVKTDGPPNPLLQ